MIAHRKGKKLICKPCGVPVGIPDNECQSGRRGDCHGPEGGSGSLQKLCLKIGIRSTSTPRTVSGQFIILNI